MILKYFQKNKRMLIINRQQYILTISCNKQMNKGIKAHLLRIKKFKGKTNSKISLIKKLTI